MQIAGIAGGEVQPSGRMRAPDGCGRYPTGGYAATSPAGRWPSSQARVPVRSEPVRIGEVNEPTAAAQAERGIALLAVVLRLGSTLSMLVGVPQGIRLAADRTIYAALTVVTLGVTTWAVAQALRSQSLRVGWWQPADLLVGVLVMPVLATVLPAETLVGTWAAWGNGHAINVAVLCAGYLPMARATAYGVFIGVLTFLVGLRDPLASVDTLLGNSLVPVVFTVCAAMFARHFRALAHRADTARAAEVRATQALELERYRLTVHDATGILRLLADDATPAEVRPALQRQAAAEANRLRNYLRDGPVTGAGETLGEILDEALVGFSDLALEVSTELGAHVRLPDDRALALGRAVATVLHNVRRHAQARTVFIHADAHDTGWEVVVRDDGIGFDRDTQRLGFGLQVQVIQALAAAGMTARIDSAPGEGTAVTIGGPTP